MRSIIKIATSLFAATGLVLGGGLSPVHAASGGTITAVVASDGTLAGSSIDGYDPNGYYYMTVLMPDSTMTWDSYHTAATVVAGGASTGYVSSVMQFQGAPDQLNLVLPEIHTNQPCNAGPANVYIEVSTFKLIQDPVSGHFFGENPAGPLFADQVTLAGSTQLGNSSATDGYLATITTPLENQIAYALDLGAYIGAEAVAGTTDFSWVGGPEAGTQFYQTAGGDYGSSVNGAYATWDVNQPQARFGSHISLTWNSNWQITEDRGYAAIVEWGGMNGDSFTTDDVGLDIASTTVNSVGAFGGGDGSEQSPYLINNVGQFKAMNNCGYSGAYYLQTDDLALSDFQGIGTSDRPFKGFYDGDNYDIDLDNSVAFDHGAAGLFNYVGVPGGSGTATAGIRNVWLSGQASAFGQGSVGLLAGQMQHAFLQNVHVMGDLTGDVYHMGGVVGEADNVDALRVYSFVNVHSQPSGTAEGIGGVFGYVQGDTSNLFKQIGYNGTIRVEGSVYFAGGIAGYVDSMQIRQSQSEGVLTVDNNGQKIGGLVGISYNTEYTDNWSSMTMDSFRVDTVGGLIGESNNDIIARAYSSGSLVGSNYVGGLLGKSNYSTIHDVYSKSAVSAENQSAGLFGYIEGGSVTRAYSKGNVWVMGNSNAWYGTLIDTTVDNVYWNPEDLQVDPGSVTAVEGGTTFTTAQATDPDFFDTWNLGTVVDGYTWLSCPNQNDGYPILEALDPNVQCTWAFANSSNPVITGTGKIGEALSADPGTWDAGVGFTYQWQADGVDIPGAIASGWIPTAAQAGKVITVVLTGQKNHYPSLSHTSNAITIETPPTGPVGTGSAASPLELPADGNYQVIGDTGTGWNRAKGQLSFKFRLYFTGPIKATLTFKSGGKNFTCSVKFGKLSKIKSTNIWLKSPYLCSGKTEKKALAALKAIPANTRVKATIWREFHNYKTYKKMKVVTVVKYLKLS